ncbi:hypothetical protein, partial [Escherichia coli]|uniref:hypothetical protein n=1 Tax=Escherichia coli TaxID=562 RepID=UPI0039DF8DA9
MKPTWPFARLTDSKQKAQGEANKPMKHKAISLMAAALLCASAWTAPVQAASFATVQPYLTDYKIGFTNGNELVTKA